jgi:hypothetical protein
MLSAALEHIPTGNMPCIPIDISVIANGELGEEGGRVELFEEHAAAAEEIRLAA